MNPTSLPSFADLNALLIQTSLKSHPSQVHGLICGILCGDPEAAKDWMRLAVGDDVSPKVTEMVQALYDDSAVKLRDFLFEMQLVIPADEQPLPERAEALTLWGQGFLSGLKLAGVPTTNREPNEVTEAINDIVEIAKMNYEDVIDTEDDEQAFVELVEYVRVAAIYIYQDLHDVEDDDMKHVMNVSDRLQ